MTTRPPGRGLTPRPKLTQEYGPVKQPRPGAPPVEPEQQAFAAETSAMLAVVEHALGDLNLKRATRRKLIAAIVTLAGLLGSAVTWSVSRVEDYTAGKVAARDAKWEAEQATARVDDAHERLDTMETKVDRIEDTLARIEIAVAMEPLPVPIMVPTPRPAPKPKAPKRGH